MWRHVPDSSAGVNAGAVPANCSTGPVMRKPRPGSRIAPIWSATTSTKVTSCPARFSQAPAEPPIAPAPQIRMGSAISPFLQQGTRLVHGDFPDSQYFGIVTLIAAAEIAVVQHQPHLERRQGTQLVDVDHRLGAFHRIAIRQAGPGEFLRPASGAGVRADSGGG